MTEIGRRGFLGLLGATVAATAAQLELDPERALWVPGRKTIFLPPETPRLASPEEVERFAVNRYDLAERYRMDLPSSDGSMKFLYFGDGWRFIRAEEVVDGVRKHVPMNVEGKRVLEAQLGFKMEDYARVGVSQQHGLSLTEGGSRHGKRAGSFQKDLTAIRARATDLERERRWNRG